MFIHVPYANCLYPLVIKGWLGNPRTKWRLLIKNFPLIGGSKTNGGSTCDSPPPRLPNLSLYAMMHVSWHATRAGVRICVELREWGVFRFGNPTSGGTVFLHVQKLFPCFPVRMNFVSHCVSLASTCWRGQKHGPRVKTEHCRPTRTELTETEMNSLVKHLIKKGFTFLECNLKASPEVKVSGVTCWCELCGKLC